MKSLDEIFENWDVLDVLKLLLIVLFGCVGVTQVFIWSQWGIYISNTLKDPNFFNQTSQATQSQFFAV
jgi:hypothetical protein